MCVCFLELLADKKKKALSWPSVPAFIESAFYLKWNCLILFFWPPKPDNRSSWQGLWSFSIMLCHISTFPHSSFIFLCLPPCTSPSCYFWFPIALIWRPSALHFLVLSPHPHSCEDTKGSLWFKYTGTPVSISPLGLVHVVHVVLLLLLLYTTNSDPASLYTPSLSQLPWSRWPAP